MANIHPAEIVQSNSRNSEVLGLFAETNNSYSQCRYQNANDCIMLLIHS